MTPLKVVSVNEIDKLHYLKAYEIHYKTKSGANAKWELVSRGDLHRLEGEIFNGTVVSDGTVIFACNRERDTVVLLKEFRVAAGKYLYMLPAGLSDADEVVEETAIREFREETGMVFEPMWVDQPRYISIGIVNERVSTVYGYYEGAPSKTYQEDHEDADVIFVDRNKAIELLSNEEVTLRTALLLQNFFKIHPFFND